ncbi:MAG: hypothetical protein ACFFCV_03540 [Promethearchaeota archaeon]
MKNSDKVLQKLIRINSKIRHLYNFGDYDKALAFFLENENKFTNISNGLRKETKQIHCDALSLISIIISYRGDLNQNLEIVKKILKIAEEVNDNYCLSIAMYGYGRYYWLSGDLTKSLKNFDNAIELINNVVHTDKNAWFLSIIMMAIRVAIMNGDLEIAREYYKQVEIKKEDETVNLLQSQHHMRLYDIIRALILKSSKRFRERAIAQELFKEIFEDKKFLLIYRLLSLVDLCELLLIELRITNDLTILDEIKPLIMKLLDFAQLINSIYFFIEAYLLQAKLALINFEFNKARRFLTQGERMAERHGYTELSIEISELHSEMLQQSEAWDNLRKSNAPVSKRMDLAHLNENLNEFIRVQMSTNAQVYEKKITVYKERKQCLVCLGEIEGFDNYICPNCDSIYCKKCAKALIEIENVCWSCESPIDKAKPIKPILVEGTEEGEKKAEKNYKNKKAI